MNICKVNYQKTFNLGSYQSERIGVEIELNVGEDPKQALVDATALVNEYHKENNKGLYVRGEMEVDIIQQPTQSAQMSGLIDDIKSCKDPVVLESYRLIVRNKPDLQAAYDETFEKLKNN